MRAVMLEVPEALLEQRRRSGADRFDEMWEGILHMVPPPSGRQQLFGTDLLVALVPIARARRLVAVHELGFFRAADDYRQPDLVVAEERHITDERGLEGPAELVVEILSPGDESRAKLDFYAVMSVSEVLFVDPVSREFELLRRSADGAFERVEVDDSGEVWCGALDVAFSVAEGPRFRVRAAGLTYDI